jgi:hypothetical protein
MWVKAGCGHVRGLCLFFARARWNRASSTAPRKPLAQPPITFQVPFTAHGFALRRVLLRVQQNPDSPAR